MEGSGLVVGDGRGKESYVLALVRCLRGDNSSVLANEKRNSAVSHYWDMAEACGIKFKKGWTVQKDNIESMRREPAKGND